MMFWTAGYLGIVVIGLCGTGQPGAAPPAKEGGLAPLTLRPDRYDARAGESVSLRLVRGGEGDGDAVTLNPGTVGYEWVFLRLHGSQENRDSLPLLAADAKPGDGANKPEAGEGDAAAGTVVDVPVVLARAGVAMIGCDMAARVELVDAAVLRERLKDRVAAGVQDELDRALPREGEVRVRRVETAKCLIRVAETDGRVVSPPDTQTVITRAGQVNEIRFTMDPTRALIGSDVQIRVFADYDKAPRAKVTAWCDAAGVAQEISLDASATGLIRLSSAGTWRVEFSVARVLKDDPAADVVVYSATAMFRTAGKEDGR